MWIRMPRTFLASALEPGDSIEASQWRSQLLASSAALNTKHLPQPSWQRAWKRGGWIQRLYGRICEPSTAQRGVDLWMESLRASRASHTVLPGSASAGLTRAISGPRQVGLFETLGPNGSSSKTYPASSVTIGIESDRNYKAWASELRRASSQRQKSARPTEGNGSSRWPSAQARDYRSVTGREVEQRDHALQNLNVASVMWSTPHAHNAQGQPGQGLTERSGRHRDPDRDAMTWEQGVALTRLTPSVSEDAAGRPGANMQQMLSQQARAWGTPSARDWKDGASVPESVPTNGLLSRQVLRTSLDGNESLQSGPTSRQQLNERFASWLMGWHPLWTSLAPLNCDSLGMASCHNRQPLPSEPSGAK